MIPLSVDPTTATISQYAMDTFDFSDIIPIIIALGAVEESRIPNYWAVESQ